MKKESNWYIRTVIKGIFSLLFIFAFIIILAGRINYWQGWVFGGICCLGATIQFLAFRNKINLAKERLKPGPGIKWWDKLIMVVYGPMFFGVFILASLDAGRFRWTTNLHWSVYIIGYITHILAYFITGWSMWVNSFFSTMVRIQTERDHVVVHDGPYRFVRHPGYVGGILLAISSSLILGSVWALIPAGVVVFLLIIRTFLEDVTLQKELQGYSHYIEKVKYRLLPGIW